MPYLTAIEKSKATSNPWFSRLLRAGNGMGLFWDTHKYLSYLFDPDLHGAWGANM